MSDVEPFARIVQEDPGQTSSLDADSMIMAGAEDNSTHSSSFHEPLLPGLSCIVQAPVQALLRPSMWLPGIRKLHSHREWWDLNGIDRKELAKNILEATRRLSSTDPTDAVYDIHKINTSFVRIFVYTWAEWLDVIEIDLSSGEVISFSSGLLPLSIPFAAILNLIFFWVPFHDNKYNRDRLKLFRETLHSDIEVKYMDERCQ